MIRRSGQQGVPVIIAGDEGVVGFDRPRLERIVAQYAGGSASGPEGVKLGLVVRDTAAGVEVGGVRPGTLGERLGVQSGDVIEVLGNQPIHSVKELELHAKGFVASKNLALSVRRNGQALHLGVPVA